MAIFGTGTGTGAGAVAGDAGIAAIVDVTVAGGDEALLTGAAIAVGADVGALDDGVTVFELVPGGLATDAAGSEPVGAIAVFGPFDAGTGADRDASGAEMEATALAGVDTVADGAGADSGFLGSCVP